VATPHRLGHHASAQRCYKCVFVCPDKSARTRQSPSCVRRRGGGLFRMRAHGSGPEILRQRVGRSPPNARAVGRPNSTPNVKTTCRIPTRPGPDIWRPDPTGPDHAHVTASHRRHDQRRRRYLKEVSASKVTPRRRHPEGSVYSGGTGRPYLAGGGEDFWPETTTSPSPTRSSPSPRRPTRSRLDR